MRGTARLAGWWDLLHLIWSLTDRVPAALALAQAAVEHGHELARRVGSQRATLAPPEPGNKGR